MDENWFIFILLQVEKYDFIRVRLGLFIKLLKCTIVFSPGPFGRCQTGLGKKMDCNQICDLAKNKYMSVHESVQESHGISSGYETLEKASLSVVYPKDSVAPLTWCITQRCSLVSPFRSLLVGGWRGQGGAKVPLCLSDGLFIFCLTSRWKRFATQPVIQILETLVQGWTWREGNQGLLKTPALERVWYFSLRHAEQTVRKKTREVDSFDMWIVTQSFASCKDLGEM